MGDCVSSQNTEQNTSTEISNANKSDSKDHEKIINDLQKENERLKKQVDALMNNRFDDVMVEIDDNKDNKDDTEFDDIDPSDPKLWLKFNKKLEQGDTEYFRKLLNSGNFNVKTHFDPDNHQSLLHLAAANGRIEIARMCINLGADLTWPDVEEKEPMFYSESGSYYHVSQLLMFEKLGGNLGSQIKENCDKISDQNGIISYVIENIKEISVDQDKSGDDILDIIEKLMIKIINKKIAFSDDLLMIAWRHSMSKYEEDPLQSPLWQCLAKIIGDVTSKSDQRDWFWFKKYLVASNIWYGNLKMDDDEEEEEEEDKENEDENGDEENLEQKEILDEDFDEEEYFQEIERKKAKSEYQKKNKTHYLFYELLKIVNIAEKAQSNWLKQPMLDIADNNPESWKYLNEYKYENELYKLNNIRQDVIPNGVKSSYKHEELTKKTNASSAFNPHSYYDINEYLSRLVMAAHFNDESFQQSIMNVFDIDKKTNQSNINSKIKYQRGPVKLLQRCKAKV